ncbi:MAG: hypothetical protein ACLF0G_14345 [Candidatus Brocadiia bacterium]
MEKEKRDKLERSKIAGPVHGIGLDRDGHVRITKMENFRLYGGSKDTHEHMQEKAIKFNERLRKHDKQVTDLNVRQFVELAGEVGMIRRQEEREDSD